jgi:ribonuclease HII
VVGIILCGADEAGRGAILGPLVVSIVAVRNTSMRRLSDIGVRDSKLLSGKRRRQLYNEIEGIASEIKVKCIFPSEINEAMANHISINELEAKNFSELFDSMKSEVNSIYLDSPDVIPERFGVRFGMYSTKNTRVVGIKTPRAKGVQYTRVVAEHKADAKYPVVSAASIIAKVTRDSEIQKLEKRLKFKIGSGYPSDDYTIRAIKENIKSVPLNEHVRNRWITLERIKQRSLLEF